LEERSIRAAFETLIEQIYEQYSKDKTGKNVYVVEWYDLPVIAAADHPLSTVVIIVGTYAENLWEVSS